MTLKKLPHLVVTDSTGKLYPHPSLKMAGRSGRDLVEVLPEELIPLPQGSEIFSMPGRIPFGFDETSGQIVAVEEGPQGQEAWACAAFVAPAHTIFLMPAFDTRPGSPRLPLFAYCSLGELDGKFYVAARRIDPDHRQDPVLFDAKLLKKNLEARLSAEPENRLVKHLSNCALVNACPAAKNFFLGRWEAPLPSSPACNSDCVGCLSFQPPQAGFPSTQTRIQFVPSAEEIVAVAAPHLENAPRPVVSFGQGCEGDPLMNPGLLEESIKKIRAATAKGVININTNGSRPKVVETLMRAGLDAIRVSMNSAQEPWYNAYYRPRGYTFSEIKESVKTVAKLGGKASINYFIFPGVSDREAEIEALLEFVNDTGLHLIQWRNLNMDPDLYLDTLGDISQAGEALGIPFLLNEVRRHFPQVRYGYFNPAWKTEQEAAQNSAAAS